MAPVGNGNYRALDSAKRPAFTIPAIRRQIGYNG